MHPPIVIHAIAVDKNTRGIGDLEGSGKFTNDSVVQCVNYEERERESDPCSSDA